MEVLEKIDPAEGETSPKQVDEHGDSAHEHDDSQPHDHDHEPQSLSLDLGSIYRTDIKHVYSFTVTPSNGDIILWGEAPQGFFKGLRSNPCSFHIYANTAEGLVKRKTVGALCKHAVVHMLPVQIAQQGELLAVSCAECHVIRLHDLEKGDTTTAFNDNDEKMPGFMCHGEAETLFMVYGEPRGDYKILHMGCSTTKFASLSRISTGISMHQQPPSICYVPAPHNVVVVSTSRPAKILRAFPLDDPQDDVDLDDMGGGDKGKNTGASKKQNASDANASAVSTSPGSDGSTSPSVDERQQRHSRHVELTQRIKREWLNSDSSLGDEDVVTRQQTTKETRREVVTTEDGATLVTRTEKTTVRRTIEVNGEVKEEADAPAQDTEQKESGSWSPGANTKKGDEGDEDKKDGDDHDHDHGQGPKTKWQHWFSYRSEACEDDVTPSALHYSRRHDVLLVGDMLNNQILVLSPDDGRHRFTLHLAKPGWVEYICAYDSTRLRPGLVRSQSFLDKVLCGGGSSSDTKKHKQKSKAPQPSESDHATSSGHVADATSGPVAVTSGATPTPAENGVADGAGADEEMVIWTDNPYSSETKQAVSFYTLRAKETDTQKET